VLVRKQKLLTDVLDEMRTVMPFPLLGLETERHLPWDWGKKAQPQ
jgi:hypothetical protein